MILWEQQVSPTVSRYSRLQYSTNRIDFIDLAAPVVTSGVDAFEYQAQTLIGIKGVNDNTNFAYCLVRILDFLMSFANALCSSAGASTLIWSGTSTS